MSVYNPDTATKAAWAALVEKQSKGLTPDEFTWFTPEDIPMKVLYTAEDTAELPYTDTMPGLSPYIRGWILLWPESKRSNRIQRSGSLFWSFEQAFV